MSDDFLDDTPFAGYEDEEQVTLSALSQIAGQAEQVLRERRTAYCRVFSGKGDAADVKVFLEDLARFCRANSSTFAASHAEHALLEGRREVWLRIQDFTTLPLDKLIEKYTTGDTK